MSSEKSKRLNPMVITDPDEGREYTLEYNIPELQRPLVRLCFSRKHAPGAIWLDMVDLRVE